jgi:hypothetical protein
MSTSQSGVPLLLIPRCNFQSDSKHKLKGRAPRLLPVDQTHIMSAEANRKLSKQVRTFVIIVQYHVTENVQVSYTVRNPKTRELSHFPFYVNPAAYDTKMGDRFTGGNQEVLNGLAKVVSPSQCPGKADKLVKIVKELVQGELSYKSGDVFVADADSHFQIDEYMTRMQKVVTQA